MDWPNERYVRFYTRDTPKWTLMSWEARGLFGLLLRVVDRSGVLDVGPEVAEGLASILRAPSEVVARALPEWTRNGCVTLRASTLVIGNYLVAQETRQSDKMRQALSRERRRDSALPDPESGDDASPAVTSRHQPSPMVTPSRAVPCLAVEDGIRLTATPAPAGSVVTHLVLTPTMAKKTRDPSKQERLAKNLLDHRASVLGPEVVPDVQYGAARVNRELKQIFDKGVDLDVLAEGHALFLVDPYALSKSPPCPMWLFVQDWPKWVDLALKAKRPA